MALLAFALPTLGVPPPVGEGESAPPSQPATVARSGSMSTKEGKKSKKVSAGAASIEAVLPPMPPTISALLDPSQRLRTAWELNAAILNAQGHASEPKLPGLMAIMNWGEGLLNEKGAEWPRCESPAGL